MEGTEERGGDRVGSEGGRSNGETRRRERNGKKRGTRRRAIAPSKNEEVRARVWREGRGRGVVGRRGRRKMYERV